MKEQKVKSKKLEEKINMLVEKIEKEDNKIKRLGYVIRCKMLVAKLQRQIDLQNAKENFEKAKEENKITAKEEKVNARSKIIELNKKIKEIESELKANDKYDIETSKFMFPEEDIEQAGGIEEYVEELNDSGRPEQVETAQKIQENIVRREELRKLKKQLVEQKIELSNIDQNLKQENDKISKQETALVVKSRFNIFSRIGSFVNSITSGIKEFFAESREAKEVDNEKVEELKQLQEDYLTVKEQVEKEYEEKMKRLEEKRTELEGKVKNTYKTKQEENAKTNRSEQALRFQEEMQELAKKKDSKTGDEKENDEDVLETIKKTVNDVLNEQKNENGEKTVEDEQEVK